jgi:hypothetical protein
VEISEIRRDFQRRYEHGFVWVAPPGNEEESMFYVNRITADDRNVANIELTSPEYGKIILNMGTAHTLRFKYPPVGVYQNGKEAYIFRRVPAKQYKHALYNGNSSVYEVWKHLVGQVPDNRAELRFDDVLAAFRGERYSFQDALKMLESGKYRSVALLRNFSLILSPLVGQSYMLLFWETPVCGIDRDGSTTTWYEKSYEPVLNQVKEL